MIIIKSFEELRFELHAGSWVSLPALGDTRYSEHQDSQD